MPKSKVSLGDMRQAHRVRRKHREESEPVLLLIAVTREILDNTIKQENKSTRLMMGKDGENKCFRT